MALFKFKNLFQRIFSIDAFVVLIFLLFLVFILMLVGLTLGGNFLK